MPPSSLCLLLVVAAATVGQSVAGSEASDAHPVAADAGADEACALQVSRRVAGSGGNLPLVPHCPLPSMLQSGARLQVQGEDSSLHIPTEIAEQSQHDRRLPPPNETGGLRTTVIHPGTIYSFATLAEMAYCGKDGLPKIKGWECKVCEASGFTVTNTTVASGRLLILPDSLAAYVGKIEPKEAETGGEVLDHAPMKSGCFISVRGSSTIAEWLSDLSFAPSDKVFGGVCPECKVHTGFWTDWQVLKPQVIEKLDLMGCRRGDPAQHLYLTGHSLGGAVATVAGLSLGIDGYHIGGVLSFEAPRVGNDRFQWMYNHFLEGSLLYRVTHHRDVVVHLPFRNWGFQHVNPEIFYETDDLSKAKVCKQTEDPSCSYQYWRYSIDDHTNVPYSRDCDISNGCGSDIFAP